MCEDVAIMLDDGMTEQEIRNTLTSGTDTETNTEADTDADTEADTDADTEADTDANTEADTDADIETKSEISRNEIVSQIWDILDLYDIDKDDMKMLKMLIKGLR